MMLEVQGPNKEKEASQGEGGKVVHHTLKRKRISWGWETSYAHKRYADQIWNIEDILDIKGKGDAKR